jgi:4-aminobutyrate aminotransferase/(S)-3-amino-2-methylpropionate transaminase
MSTISLSTPAIAQERKVVTAIPGPKSQAMHERRKQVVPPGVGAALPVYIDSASGSIVVDIDGNHFIDFATGIGVTTIGHTNGAVAHAVAEQVNSFTHTCFTVTPYEEYVRVAELLVAEPALFVTTTV